MVSTSPLRTVTLWPKACETSVSAAVAPPARAVSSTCAATSASVPAASAKRFSDVLTELVIDGLEAEGGPLIGYDSKPPFRDPWRRHATIRRNTPANGTGGTRTELSRPPPRGAGDRRRRPIGAGSVQRPSPGPVENAPQDRDARSSEPGGDAGSTFRAATVRPRPARATFRRDRTGARHQQARGAAQANAIHRQTDARCRSRADPGSARAGGRGAGGRKSSSG